MVLYMTRNNIDTFARGLSVASLIAVIFAVFAVFHGADSPFLAFSVMGASVIHASKKPSYREIAITVLLAGALAAAYRGPIVGVTGALAFLGLGSMLALGWKACKSTPDLSELLLATFCPLLIIVTNFGLVVTGQVQPLIYDRYLYRIDELMFGFQPSFVVGQWFISFPLLREICAVVYGALPLAEVVTFVMFLRSKKEMPFNPILAFCIAGTVGFVLYQVCPAAGPLPCFGSAVFPQNPPQNLAIQAVTADSSILRNAMPSLHTTWVLLILWSVWRYSKMVRLSAFAFVVFTLLATLGLGEHYAIDLVAGVPTAMLTVWCTNFNFASLKMKLVPRTA